MEDLHFNFVCDVGKNIKAGPCLVKNTDTGLSQSQEREPSAATVSVTIVGNQL